MSMDNVLRRRARRTSGAADTCIPAAVVGALSDFAQVEVDDQQVNLTGFSLLFPEKRPFFLENAGFFTVGGGGAGLFIVYNEVQGIETLTGPLGRWLYLKFTRQLNLLGV